MRRTRREIEPRARTMVAPATATAGVAARQRGRRAEAQPWRRVLLGFEEAGARWGAWPRGRWPLAAGRGGAGAARGEVGRFANAGLRGGDEAEGGVERWQAG